MTRSNPKDSSFIHFAKSSDDGETWTDPVRISIKGGDCLDGDDTVEGAMPALGKDGMTLCGLVWATWPYAAEFSGPRANMEPNRANAI